eukprot:TRINITY_DN19013_c0_g1_i2.p1 TRINITY_DN19013_c0_g1~~TRINITY_DN19013_c0_g1_i2.p1  ORF type:complete len:64 (-),score=1.92 TRINITY_DN19013_c0_g1_i2:68-229(-)
MTLNYNYNLELTKSRECSHTSWVWDLDVTKDEKYFLTASGDNTIALWDVETMQ